MARPTSSQPIPAQSELVPPGPEQPGLVLYASPQPAMAQSVTGPAPAAGSHSALLWHPAPAAPHPSQDVAAPALLPLQRRAAVVPLAAERYKIQFTATAATRDKLRRAQELLRHRIPDGDINEVIDQALDLLVRDLEKKKFAALALRTATADHPSAAQPRARAQERAAAAPGSRHIPAAVRRAVWKRDQGRCAFTGANGERCEERSGLEFDHIRPHADGGDAGPNNIRLLCRRHNQYEARQFFGVWQADGLPFPRCG